MKYQFFGKKVTYTGKTLWEIVANLKNFGVGRLIKMSMNDCYPEPSFMKIVKIQVLPPSKQPFEERWVQAWVENIHRGVNQGVKKLTITKLATFMLIPKMEEEKYYKAYEEMDPEKRKKYLKKYCTWPPLYKMIWENSAKKELSDYNGIPKLLAVTEKYPEYEVIIEDEASAPSTCSLYKSELSVEEMYREIVKLKKIIKANS